MTRTTLALTLASLVLLMTAAPAADAGEGWWGDLDKGEVVELADIMAEPTGFSDRQLTFTCVTSGKANVFFQESAIISRQRYTNYAVWPDGAVVWQHADYVGKDFPFLFIAKNHFQHDELLGLRKFTRIEVTGRIKAVLRNKAHIEVTSWRPTSHRLGRLVVDAMMRGDKYAQAGEWDIAVERYKEALRPDLPPKYSLVIRKQLAAVLRQLGRNEEADRVDAGGILSSDDYRNGQLPLPTVKKEGVPPPGPGVSGPDGMPPPIDDELPGIPVNGPTGTTPVAPGAGATAAPPKPRSERVNPFLDEDLPGQAMGSGEREPEFAPIGRRDRPGPTPVEPTGNGFPPPDMGPPAPRVVEPAAPPAAPTPFAPSNDDLPGQPVNPTPAPPPAGTTPAPIPSQPPTAAPAEDAAPRTPSGRPILPPKRRPRLAGVK